MNRRICMAACVAAFLAGLFAVAWIGVGYLGHSLLALSVTVLIGAVHVAGALELRRFHRATAALEQALANIPETLAHPGEWLSRLPPSLRNPVRLRLEGERVGLPGPAMTPYLVGLLVLLGMLGTFLGMVVTLNGAVLALESTTDLHTIRAALAAPVKGLGFAFGTSVAGVAASAMLGLMSALCRRARLQASQWLDAKIATTLRGFSRAHQREESFRALQRQAQALPEVVSTLQAMMTQMERQGRELNERLAAEQQRFYQDARGAYGGLADSVGASLRDSLAESARLAGESIRPAVETTMAGIAQETAALQQRVADAVAAQLDGIAARFDAAVTTVSDTWTTALARHEQSSATLSTALRKTLDAFTDTFARRSEALIDSVGDQAAALQAQLAAGEAARRSEQTAALAAMSASLQQEWQQAGEQARAQQERICATLDDTARRIAETAQAQAGQTIAQVARLMQTAAEAPRVAAEVIGQLRQELSASVARDNDMLAERSRIMEALGALLDAINHASTEQRAAIDALVASSADTLQRAGSQFSERIEAQSARMTETASLITGGAVEVASLSEAFALAVQLFSESNDKLMTTLQRIEGALDKSMTRSDEQLAYYVTQAREIIDLSLMSQKQIIDDLQQISARQPSLAGEV
ncbi:MAG: DUF802 domain-containing protein [Betaproteobacteria bacterium]|nr:MAG: DUF802 domain-containing protein [Betaproteobacteria bacterium]